MIQQIPKKQLMDFWPFFEGNKMRNSLAFSLSLSHVKGFTDDLENPDVVMFLCQPGHVTCYLAGNSKAENLKEFLEKIPEKAWISIPSQEWELSLKTQWTYFGYSPRTELSAKNLSLQSIKRLLISLPEGFQMKRVDIEVAKQVLSQNFSDHFVWAINYFGSPERFVEEGVGFCIQEGEKIVCIAMGYTTSVPITQSCEIDIATHTDYRGRGFATLASAKVIEYFLEKGIEPHWDAANPLSVKLAEKLGYTDPEPHKFYYWLKSPWTISKLKEAFDPQFEKGLENVSSVKSEIGSVMSKGLTKKGKKSLLSRLTGTRGIFELILTEINRVLETKIVAESDIPQFKEYGEKVKQQLDTLDQLKNDHF
ncbi:MAG: GNAT family N-acetyltransferase [Candidatus Heimdallarchaeota archaeon]|nr:MAG: GNAT family N-acetyltransferase [Candidatus Heimdallarchaeota archaeon]